MKKLLALLLALIMVLSMVACGAKETPADDQTQEPADDQAQEPAEDTPAETPDTMVIEGEEAAEEEEVQYATEITMNGFGFKNLDPNTWNAGYEAYQQLIFDPLIWIDNATGETEMMLAESVEWDNEECSRIHVVLRDDVVFSNGTPVTSADCVFSHDRITYGAWANNYAGCEIVSDTEYYINLNGPCTAFMDLLGTVVGSIVCKAECEANPDGLALIGSGPYTYNMDTYVAATSIDLVRNDLFWGEQNPTEVIHIVNVDPSAAAVAIQNGEINFMINVPEADLAALDAAENVTLQQYSSYNFVYMGFNDMDDSDSLTEEEKNFRRAVACAINKEDIVLGMGGGQVMTSMYKFDADWYIANESDYEHDLSYNPEKAAEYLAQAGGKTEFTCLVSTDRAWCKIAAQVIQEYLKQVGITMNIEETDQTGFGTLAKYDVNEYEAQIYSNLFVAEAVNWNYYTPFNSVNRVRLNDTQINEALAELKACTDPARKIELYQIMQSEVHDNVTWLPLAFRQMNFAYTPGLEGFSVTPSPTYQIREIRLRLN